MKITPILKSYLDKTLVTTPITGGDSESNQNLENEIFVHRLQENSKFNNRLIITFIVVLLISFIFLCFLIWYFITDKVVVTALLGGEGLSILFIIRKIHRLYKDKVFTDHLLYLIPKLNSEQEKIKYLQTLVDFLK